MADPKDAPIQHGRMHRLDCISTAGPTGHLREYRHEEPRIIPPDDNDDTPSIPDEFLEQLQDIELEIASRTGGLSIDPMSWLPIRF